MVVSTRLRPVTHATRSPPRTRLSRRRVEVATEGKEHRRAKFKGLRITRSGGLEDGVALKTWMMIHTNVSCS